MNRRTARRVVVQQPQRETVSRIGGWAWPIYLTAFLEGMVVIVVEIAGARALAPFYGTSLQVWTAQITMTLFFLAAGYGIGGLVSKGARSWTVPALFAVAGGWLILYPFLRTPVLEVSRQLGVGPGSLIGASILFGATLMMLGAVSPVLVAVIDQRRPGAGSAAGRLFFTNTMGGLVGGWITAFAIIPYSSLRESLVTAGLCLLALALMWAAARRTAILGGAILLIFLAGLGIRFLYEPRREFRDAYGGPLKLIYSHQSGTGLLQVIDHAGSRLQLINGVTQGEMSLRTGRMVHDHVESMSVLAYMHHPQAKTALILGLGPGVLAKELDLRGLDVTAVELELRVAELAGKYFYLPANVRVAIEDARTFLREDTHSYDLIFLDAYAGETTAWYLLTFEAMREMKSRLNSGGKLVINNAAWINHKSAGLVRIEATALAVFNHAMVYPDALSGDQTERISNTIIVAGDELSPQTIVPSGAEIPVNLAASLAAKALPAVSGALITTDDRSDLDYVESQLRIRWRGMVWDWMRTNMLGD